MAGLCACYFSAAREIEFFTRNRRGHDRRYGLDSEMISSTVSFDKAVKKTVRWYIESKSWVSGVNSADYRSCLRDRD